jgi:hypothetical protein
MATYLEILCSDDGEAPVIYGHRQLAPRQTVGHVFDTLPVPSPPRATNFGLLKLCPQNGPLSIYSAGHGWQYI